MALENTASLTIVLNGTGFTSEQGGTDFPFEIDIDEEMEPAWAAIVAVRTDANTGNLTMTDGGHDITTGSRIDIHWVDVDGVNRCQRGVTVGTVAGTDVPFDSGVGDDLPAALYAVSAMVAQLWTGSVTEANIEGFAFSIIGTTTGSQVCVGTGTFTENAAFLLNGSTWISTTAAWSDGIPGWTSPLDAATTITKIYYSHGDTENSATFRGKIGHS